MSDDYEDYSYEDENFDKKATNKKRIFIVVLLIVAIIIIIVLLKSCGNGKDKDGDKPIESAFDYEKVLLEAGKKYYEYNEHKLPSSIGECTTVDLTILGSSEGGYGLITTSDFEKCDSTNTFVKVCMLEDKSLQYVPWLSCTDKKSEEEYDVEKEGTVSDVEKDESYVSFKFLPQVLKEASTNLGVEEEIWKDEIKYSAYKTLATIKKYRYKDQQWIWNTVSKTYYSSTGDKDSAKNVNEYYPYTPNTKYNLSDSKATAYKWYTEESKTKDYYMKDGSKAWSMTAPEGYPYKGTGTNEAKIVLVYRSRTIVENKEARYYYRCKTSSTSSTYVDQQVPCYNASGENTQNPAYTYTAKTFWGCPPGSTAEGNVVEGSFCHVYSEWTNSLTSCGTENHLCDHGTATFYNWYRLIGDGVRTYYPSRSNTASGEKIYYISAPVSGAIKDTTTGTTAYKWYYQTEGQTSTYMSESPGTGATKTDKTQYTEWNEWDINEPKSTSYRTIESRILIRLQEIKGSTEEDWQNLSEDYLTEEEVIKLFVEKGYKVETLADISNEGSIRYKVKMFIRNKKEVNTNE